MNASGQRPNQIGFGLGKPNGCEPGVRSHVRSPDHIDSPPCIPQSPRTNWAFTPSLPTSAVQLSDDPAQL